MDFLFSKVKSTESSDRSKTQLKTLFESTHHEERIRFDPNRIKGLLYYGVTRTLVLPVLLTLLCYAFLVKMYIIIIIALKV